MPDRTQVDGGQRLRKAIHVARARADVTSDSQLALQAGVSYDTLMNWFSGRTTPRPAELQKVARVLELRLVDLMDAWDGRDPTPPSLEERIAELIDEIRLDRAQRDESTMALMRALGALLPEALGPRGTLDGSGRGARAGTTEGD